MRLGQGCAFWLMAFHVVPTDAIEIDAKGEAVADEAGQGRLVIQGFVQRNHQMAGRSWFVHASGDQCCYRWIQALGHGDQQNAAFGSRQKAKLTHQMSQFCGCCEIDTANQVGDRGSGRQSCPGLPVVQMLLQPFEEKVTHAARTRLQPEPSDAGPADAEQLYCKKSVGPKLRTSDVECLFEGFVGAEFSHGRCCR